MGKPTTMSRPVVCVAVARIGSDGGCGERDGEE